MEMNSTICMRFLGMFAHEMVKLLTDHQSLHGSNAINATSTEATRRFNDGRTGCVGQEPILANISHELHTPMNAVIGLGYLLQNLVECRSKGLVDKIDSAGKSLLAIINDILDVTRIEAGEMQIEPHPSPLRT